MRLILCFFLCSLPLYSAPSRMLVLGGDLVEIIYALGQENLILATDDTASFPQEAQNLPKVGYLRSLAAEGLLALKPGFILANSDAGPPHVLDQLTQTGIFLKTVKTEDSFSGLSQKIREIAGLLEVPRRGEELLMILTHMMSQAYEYPVSSTTKVLFILNSTTHGLMIAGENTSAHAALREAKITNAANFSGYKTVGSEQLLTLKPDCLILASHSLTDPEDLSSFLQNPGVKLLFQGQPQCAFSMDTQMLLGFGPRLPQAILELRKRLHEELRHEP